MSGYTRGQIEGLRFTVYGSGFTTCRVQGSKQWLRGQVSKKGCRVQKIGLHACPLVRRLSGYTRGEVEALRLRVYGSGFIIEGSRFIFFSILNLGYTPVLWCGSCRRGRVGTECPVDGLDRVVCAEHQRHACEGRRVEG